MALKLVSKTTFPENLRSSAQYARYLFYIGRIKAVQLEHSDAHGKLTTAIRKAPQGPKAARGFRLAATKMAIVVELLMGDIPDRSTFNQDELKKSLSAYEAIVQAVRTGDLHSFKNVMDSNKDLFKRDGTLFLIRRLQSNVIKAGLRLINLSYSRISLADVAMKLGLDSAADAEGIVGKAILDGVIEASIDHDKQYVQSKANTDVYASDEPLKAFHKRVYFCLQLHNDAVKAMQYPDEKTDDAEEAEIRRQREKEILAQAGEEEGGDDMDFF
ncbi:unnamed protein product [Vitrella brassicaformis CCMP3155]|uniref:PCI domain-containing protein n=1 Tax=Vitrella brassicaformis (strain CCMP3155) TaxID=1169540 RepID=A0A0G4H0V9_VITBC|nr:unnamed protein product [Vitrella brassicaformis CCMP3155]|eukprot:CEM37052.1 unnamed protein product [Vitrella brassicaformis CCMP3155]